MYERLKSLGCRLIKFEDEYGIMFGEELMFDIDKENIKHFPYYITLNTMGALEEIKPLYPIRMEQFLHIIENMPDDSSELVMDDEQYKEDVQTINNSSIPPLITGKSSGLNVKELSILLEVPHSELIEHIFNEIRILPTLSHEMRWMHLEEEGKTLRTLYIPSSSMGILYSFQGGDKKNLYRLRLNMINKLSDYKKIKGGI